MDVTPYIVRDLGIIMAVAAIITFVFHALRQPLIPGYLIAGILIGPYSPPFSLVSRLDVLDQLADLGVILLVFGIGLHFPVHRLARLRFSTYFTISVIEIALMFLISFGIGWGLGWPLMDSLFLGAALSSSSSVIIVKVLADMGKLEDMSALLMMGVLIVEDSIVVVILAVITPVVGESGTGPVELARVLGQGMLFVVGTLLIGRLIIPRLIDWVARPHSGYPHEIAGHNELLILLSLGLCFGWSALSHVVGLSVAIGAFLTGTLVAGAWSSDKVESLVSPVRDMFAAVFFVTMGALIDVTQFRDFVVPALIITAAMITGKTLGCGLSTKMLGYSNAIALKVGLGMGQIGEFAFVVMRVGQDLDVVSPTLFPSIGLAVAVTVFLTPYMIRLSYRLSRNMA